MTKTSAFLLPATDIPYGVIRNYGFKNAYIGDRKKEETYPKFCLYLLFEYTPDMDMELIANMIRENTGYIDEYDPADNQIVFVVQVPERWWGVYTHFTKGKYSRFGEEYIRKYFSKYVFAGVDDYGKPLTKESINYKVLTKCPDFRKEIEEDLGVTFLDEYELMSKPDFSQEYLN